MKHTEQTPGEQFKFCSALSPTLPLSVLIVFFPGMTFLDSDMNMDGGKSCTLTQLELTLSAL